MANSKQTLRERSVSFENQLIENNLGLVRYIARRYQSTQYSMESLFSVGAAGLVKAARTYRSERDVLFSTYAGRCIPMKFSCTCVGTENIKRPYPWMRP